MYRPARTFLLLSFAGLLGYLFIPPADALHNLQNGETSIARSCVGSHCSFVDYWSSFDDYGRLIGSLKLHASLSMDTILEAPTNGLNASCVPGQTLTIPIKATGEIIGAGSAFYDSPPIHFLPNGVWRAITNGIPVVCTNSAQARCDQIFANNPIEGTWKDVWTVTGATAGSVTCSSNAEGTIGTCTVAPGTQGTIAVELARTVDDPIWKFKDTPSSIGLFVGDYGTMKSATTINCPAPTSPNLTAAAVSLLPTAPIHNDGLSVNATIENKGTGTAAASVSRLRFDQGADGTWDVGSFDQDTTALGAGTTTNPAWIGVWTAPGGTHRLEVCADVTNQVSESDETDNCRVLVFTVRQPFLACTPSLQTVKANELVGFLATGGANHTPRYRWIAGGGSPDRGEGESFSTSYASAGAQTVGLIEHYVDVDGDGYATTADAQSVLAARGGSESGSGARWQNQANRFDVNGDGSTTRLDAQIASDYADTFGAGALPIVDCAVSVSPATTTTTPETSAPSYEPAPAALCTPATQSVAVNSPAVLHYTLDGEARWEAVGGTPPSSAGTRDFTTQFATPGTYTVRVAPPFFYDVNGDGYITAFDVQSVAAKVNGTSSTTPTLTGSAWQNASNPHDVNSDGSVTPLDALNVINYLNRYGSGALPATTCTVTATGTQTPTGVGPTADFTVPATVLINDPIPAVSSSTAGTCPGATCAALTNTWQVSRVSDGVIVTPPTASTPTISVVGDTLTQYKFTLTVVDALNRQSTATKFVQVIARPVEQATDPTALCTPLTQTATVNTPVTFDSTVGDTHATWSAPDGTPTSGTGTRFSVSFATPGTKVVKVSALVPPFLDVTGDGAITFADAVAVTNNMAATTGPGTGAAWQNQTNRFDVNADGLVTPVGDVLRLFNYINANGVGMLPSLECRVEVAAAPVAPTLTCPAAAPWYDVTGDNAINADDHAALVAAANRGLNTTEPGTGAAWQNQTNRFDVNGDGLLTPVGDVRAVVDYINAGGPSSVPQCTPTVDTPSGAICPPRAPWYDVTGDNSVTAADHAALVAAANGGINTTEPGSGSAPWQNQVNRFDVNADGLLTPVGDVRALADYINTHGEGALPTCAAPPPPPPPNGSATGTPFNPGPIRETE